ncbi:serine hydrolase [Kitasatospora sp. NPDC127059]|uniref:serine hydrolase n=1 Tax=unclassified Kitasatospora TaxID=2633591 RepID=UPI0036479A23
MTVMPPVVANTARRRTACAVGRRGSPCGRSGRRIPRSSLVQLTRLHAHSPAPQAATASNNLDGFITDYLVTFRVAQKAVKEMVSIRIDTSSLTYTQFTLLAGEIGWVDGAHAPSINLAPGEHSFQQASGIVSFSFTVSPNGTVDYPSEYEGFLKGRSTGTLLVHGYPVTLDARKLSHGLQLQIVNAGMLAQNTDHGLTLAPGADYMFLAGSGIIPDFKFTLGKDGKLSINRRYAGFASINGSTLTINGYTLTVDGRKLSHALQPVSLFNANPVLSQDRTHELTFIPAPEYQFQSASGIVADFSFALGADGRLNIDTNSTWFADVKGRTLTINGYRVTLDGTSLPYDLKPELLGWTGGVLSRTSTHEIGLIPAHGYRINAPGGGIAPFAVTLTYYGLTSAIPSILKIEAAAALMDGGGRDCQIVIMADNSTYQSSLQKWWREKKYRLVDLAGYEVGAGNQGAAEFLAVFQQAHMGNPYWQHCGHYMTPREFAQFNHDNGPGWKITRQHGFTVNNNPFISAIYENSIKVDDPQGSLETWRPVPDKPLAQWPGIRDAAHNDGYRIIDIDGNTSWWDMPTVNMCEQKPDNPNWMVTVSEISKYQTDFNGQTNAGYRPVRVYGAFGRDAGGADNDVQYIFALWEKNDGRHFISSHIMTGAQFMNADTQAKASRHRLTCLGAYGVGRGRDAVASYTAVWEKRDAVPVVDTMANQFMDTYQVPGMALAISRAGKLVYANGYGLAGTGVRATPQTLWRIASVSKAITAAAVLLLVQQNKIQLKDHVFGPTGILGGHYVNPADRTVESVTVEDLLHHTSGGWPNDANDPMFEHTSWNQHDLITWVLETRSLDHPPGTCYAYSNFGYCVLGRVIEQVTGQPYQTYVQSNILQPCGISDMVIAGDTRAEQLPTEAVYFGEGQDDPYGIPVRRMDSHGGWIASALDMLRFANRVDGFPNPTQILNPGMISYLSTPSGVPDAGDPNANPPVSRTDWHYACGWWIQLNMGTSSDWQANGDLPGTTATLARANDDFCIAAVTNTRKRQSKDQYTEPGLQNLVWNIYDQVDNWTNGPDI